MFDVNLAERGCNTRLDMLHPLLLETLPHRKLFACLHSFPVLSVIHFSKSHSFRPFKMRSSVIFASLATLLSSCAAQKVVGSAMGFAKGATGGGSATPAVPKDIAQLKTWLSDSVARVIVIDKE